MKNQNNWALDIRRNFAKSITVFTTGVMHRLKPGKAAYFPAHALRTDRRNFSVAPDVLAGSVPVACDRTGGFFSKMRWYWLQRMSSSSATARTVSSVRPRASQVRLSRLRAAVILRFKRLSVIL